MLDVFHEFMTDILIADDGFLLLNKEYEIDPTNGKILKQKIFEITRLHPALTEYDIDRKDGLPERSHFLCPVHREQQTHTYQVSFSIFSVLMLTLQLLPIYPR